MVHFFFVLQLTIFLHVGEGLIKTREATVILKSQDFTALHPLTGPKNKPCSGYLTIEQQYKTNSELA